MARGFFADRTVLITGASSGIGAALARLFAADGARLALAARREDRLRALAQEIQQPGRPSPLVLVADLSDAAACDALCAAALRELGRVDVLVNNAGLGELGPLVELDPAAVQRMIDVNITALTRLTRALAPAMAARREGWIMNVASAAAFQPMPLMGVYAATKAYVLSFSESLHHELRSHGVRVCCACPGTTRTEFFERGGFERHHAKINRMAMPVEKVASMAYDALARGRMTKVTGLSTALQVWLPRLFPRRAVVSAVGYALSKLRG